MQGMIQSLAEKAGRHLLQLMTLLKENMLARVALFTVICALIFPVFTVIDGLGDSSQAITAFSEGTVSKEKEAVKGGFKEIKGMKEVQEFKGLNNPFEEGQGRQGRRDKFKKSGITEADNRNANGKNPSRENTKEAKDKKAPKGIAPRIKGIVEGSSGPAVLLEYGGSQYMLSTGDVVDNIFVEAVGENSVKVNVQGRIMWVER
ncbi:hypothetical protein SAMN02745671_00042 [Anaerovibrio lipolyticus DSM 3074]|uniref:Uncharacterized protein n=2 Tax=Anaerovibrio lipolyticus TaxID=82374 RepID=A0A0B2JY11_9FIRM|nr:hypothetical protein [Anaerovibrio lipolyticus]KHM52489.1 hypothetical protein NZ47_04530 [Anaerovibrio lipolyticus]SHI28928.1 hypothetical protein SAMN02745671_00042 [Anaerovibrio lipolyticus DSM 3074]